MNELEERMSQPVSKEITVIEARKELEKNKTKRILFAIGGTLALVLAVLGIIVPGLPCTPFALLSAALFAKSSDRLYNWLLNNKILGSRIKNYQRRKGISKKGKIKVILLMWTMVLISSFLIIKAPTLKVIILSAGLLGAITVWFFVPEGKDYTKGDV
ncbi:YbaN family protein [Petrimonas sp.]|uniref:YbaN family protein n=1 Tax=Petrimonas sp. TaxID=2023866 RepID=UPI003F50F089